MRSKTLSSFAVTLFIFFSSTFIKAQMQKGTWLAEGNIGNIEVYKHDGTGPGVYGEYESKESGFAFSLFPRLGYFVTSRFVIGTTLGFSYDNYSRTDYTNMSINQEYSSKESIAGLNPFLRLYFGKSTKNMFYVQAGFGGNFPLFSKQESVNYYNIYPLNNGKSVVKYSNSGFELTGEALIGFNHFFTESLAFNTAIGYYYGNRTVEYVYSTSQNVTILNPSSSNNVITNRLVWNFGFTFLFPGEKRNQ